jgi:hypothetical protein
MDSAYFINAVEACELSCPLTTAPHYSTYPHFLHSGRLADDAVRAASPAGCLSLMLPSRSVAVTELQPRIDLLSPMANAAMPAAAGFHPLALAAIVSIAVTLNRERVTGREALSSHHAATHPAPVPPPLRFLPPAVRSRPVVLLFLRFLCLFSACELLRPERGSRFDVR